MSSSSTSTNIPLASQTTNDLSLFQTPWTIVYLGICITLSIVLALAIFLPLGFSAASDRVFGFEVLISGMLGDIVFTRLFHRRMMLLRGVRVPAIVIWPILGIALMLGALVLKQPSSAEGVVEGKTVDTTEPPIASGARLTLLPVSAKMMQVSDQQICSEEIARQAVQVVLVAFILPSRFEYAVNNHVFGDSPEEVAQCLRLWARIGTARVVHAAPAEPSIGQLANRRAEEILAKGGPDFRSQVSNDFGGDYSALAVLYLSEIADFYADAYNGDWSAAAQTQYAQYVGLHTLLLGSMDSETSGWYLRWVSATIDDYTPILARALMQAEAAQN